MDKETTLLRIIVNWQRRALSLLQGSRKKEDVREANTLQACADELKQALDFEALGGPQGEIAVSARIESATLDGFTDYEDATI